jgi:hypothetical protein
LDFCMYVGFTEQQIQKEAFEFMRRRGANLPRKRDGEIPRNQNAVLPLGVRLWRDVAMGQGEKDNEPEMGVVYKVFVTFNVHAAIKEGVCYVNH